MIQKIEAGRSRVVRGLQKLLATLASGLVVSSAASACLYDEDDRCGPNERYEKIGCLCVDGATRLASGACVLCAENEVAAAMGCECAEGFTRPDSESACEPLPAGLGVACDATSPCGDPAYSHCQSDPFGDYCTATGCETSSDCPPKHACTVDGDATYCRRPPVGRGQSCKSSADCAETEATFCETFSSFTCVVENCSSDPDDCFEGDECCDLTPFGLAVMCVPQGECPQ